MYAAPLSGCRESNSDRTHPMGVYYHYTTARDDPVALSYVIFENYSICARLLVLSFE